MANRSCYFAKTWPKVSDELMASPLPYRRGGPNVEQRNELRRATGGYRGPGVEQRNERESRTNTIATKFEQRKQTQSVSLQSSSLRA